MTRCSLILVLFITLLGSGCAVPVRLSRGVVPSPALAPVRIPVSMENAALISIDNHIAEIRKDFAKLVLWITGTGGILTIIGGGGYVLARRRRPKNGTSES